MKNNPKDKPAIGTVGFGLGEDIEVTGLRSLLGGQEYARSAMGHRLAAVTIDFATPSTSYTQSNVLSGGRSLGEFCPVVHPMRQDVDGFSIGATAQDIRPQVGNYLVEVLVFATNASVRISFAILEDTLADAEDYFATSVTIEAADPGWYSAHIVLPLDADTDAYRVEVDAKRSASVAKGNGAIKCIEIWEPRKLWMSSWGLVPDHYGDEWIDFPTADTEPVAVWAADGALRQWTQSDADYQPTFVRHGVRANVHSVAFDGSQFFGPVPASTNIGFLSGNADFGFYGVADLTGVVFGELTASGNFGFSGTADLSAIANMTATAEFGFDGTCTVENATVAEPSVVDDGNATNSGNTITFSTDGLDVQPGDIVVIVVTYNEQGV